MMLWFFLKFALKVQDFDSNICASGEKWSNFANLFKFDEIWGEFEICEIYWVSRQIIEESAIVQSSRGTISLINSRSTFHRYITIIITKSKPTYSRRSRAVWILEPGYSSSWYIFGCSQRLTSRLRRSAQIGYSQLTLFRKWWFLVSHRACWGSSGS